MSTTSYPALRRADVFEGMCEIIRNRTELNESTGCRIWSGAKNQNGYGVLKRSKRYYYAHRVAYAIRNGDIPAGLVIDHLCRNPSCVNPDHLELVDQATNALRGMSPIAIAVRTNRCIRGHEFTTENTYTAAKTGYRQCKACNTIRRRLRTSKATEARRG